MRTENLAEKLKLPPNVFVNCPFDDGYKTQFRTIAFTVLHCGCIPRCALEIVDSAQTRISKIQAIIADCRLGVHDISRTELNKNGLPRFNMPFELGLFLGAKRYGNAFQKQKRCLILDREQYRYQEFISDIAGQDVEGHQNEPHQIILKVRDFLDNALDGQPLSSGSVIRNDYERLTDNLPAICKGLDLSETGLSFKNYTWIVAKFLSKEPVS
jgi:hypothetical protein